MGSGGERLECGAWGGAGGGGEISFHENPLSAWKEDLGRGPTEGKEKRSGVGLLVGRAVWEYAGSGTPFASGGQDIGQRNQQLHTVGRAGTVATEEVMNCDVVLLDRLSSHFWT